MLPEKQEPIFTVRFKLTDAVSLTHAFNEQGESPAKRRVLLAIERAKAKHGGLFTWQE